MVDHGAVLDPPHKEAFSLVIAGLGGCCNVPHFITSRSIAILTGTPFLDCSKYFA